MKLEMSHNNNESVPTTSAIEDVEEIRDKGKQRELSTTQIGLEDSRSSPHRCPEVVDAHDPEAVEKFMQSIEAECAEDEAAQTRFKFSKRNPDIFEWNDPTTHIERLLTENNHKIWGFVAYRCTYDDEDEWQEVLESLEGYIKSELEHFNALDLYESHELTILEDRALFEDATVAQLRDHFKAWVSVAPALEQGDDVGPGDSPRYKFFLRVCKENLDFFLKVDPAERAKGFSECILGHVDLVNADLIPNVMKPYEPPHEEDWPVLEGSRDYDVGWARFDYQCYLHVYCQTGKGWICWWGMYVRPPYLINYELLALGGVSPFNI